MQAPVAAQLAAYRATVFVGWIGPARVPPLPEDWAQRRTNRIDGQADTVLVAESEEFSQRRGIEAAPQVNLLHPFLAHERNDTAHRFAEHREHLPGAFSNNAPPSQA